MRKNLKRKAVAIILPAALAVSICLSACSSNASVAAVQSVAYIAGVGTVGIQERFAGVVCAKNEETVKSDKTKTILEVLVKEGDQVTEGQSLCTYDISLASLNLEKAKLELTQLENSLSDKKAEKATLEKQKAEANENNQLEYTLEIQRCDTEIREYEYNINLKKKDVESLEKSAAVGECTAPVAGRIKSIKGVDGDETSTEVTFVITEAGDYRVMGYINENNASALSEGIEVTVRSRVNSDTWSGIIQSIDWESAQSTNSDSSTSDSLTQTSKYPFYIQLDSSEGLLLGQHVYIEPAVAEKTEAELYIPSYYFVSVDGETAYVWAENSSGKLEKRSIKVSATEDAYMYTVVSGLTADDYIAFPSEELKTGMKCEEYDGEIPQETVEGETAAEESVEVLR